MHPSKEIQCLKSEKLKGKRIILGLTGSIAVIETVKLARELIRNGAEVFAVMSKEAQKIITPIALQYATGNEVITEITGKVEHVSFCGETKDKVDLLLIAPCTANTISKISCGVDDTPITTFVSTALGSKIPILIVPAMHISMQNNDIIKENIAKLKKIGIEFIEGKEEEMAIKFPSIEEVVLKVIRKIGKNDLKGKKFLIISGSTIEPIDDIRILTNRSSGKTGIELAKSCYERNANVKLLVGKTQFQIPNFINVENFESVKDLISKINFNYDVIIVSAAISDYTVNKQEGKISSEKEELILKLKQNPKVISYIRKNFKGTLIGFKLETKLKEEELIEKAYKKLKDENLDLVIANRLEDVKLEENIVFIIDKNKNVEKVVGKKSLIAEKILDRVK